MTILKLKKDRQAAAPEPAAPDLAPEAQQMAELYPGFELEREMENSRFAILVQAGVSLADAYAVVHLEEIARMAALKEKENIRREITDVIRARAMRVEENGLASHCALSLRRDVAGLSREQRADYARRAAKGEEITFKR